MTAELKAFDAGVDLGLYVGGSEKEIIAGLRLEQLAAGRIGIAIAHEAYGIARMAEETGSQSVAGSPFHEHA